MTAAATPFTGLGRRRYDRASDQYNAFEIAVPKFKGPTKTQQLRDLIQQHGRMRAGELAERVDLANGGLVGGLLKNDIALGRVRFDGACYCWNEDYDERLGESIADAIALLRRHGFRVEPPAARKDALL
jgi:hypothetical protein